MAFKMYWACRDLASSPAGNHHFILIYPDMRFGLPPIPILEDNRTRFVTLGGFEVHKNLEFVQNEPSDVKSVREHLNPKQYRRWYLPDLDLMIHQIHRPSGSEKAFCETLVKQAINYRNNTKITPVTYSLSDNNCSAWVNTMLKIAGVNYYDRKSLGEFRGIDWGEEDLLDETLFK
ncbi:MAG: hypothetical protein GY737_03815 [Desulfobacteraceae bacterium]|nr:hypothetical protein [Desulfobacteraceae bacterium]